MCICSNLINLLTAEYIDLIFITIGLGFAFLVVFYRFLLVKHVSLIGDYLEICNILSFPFVLIIYRFVPNSSWIIFYFDLAFHAFVVIVIIIVQKLKVRRARKISIILLQNADNSSLPQVVSDSFVSTIRILVKINANPAVFERLLQQYQQSGLKSSIVLEIVRFLSVFPGKRKKMVLLLRTLNSKTNYNIFMTYLFHKTLASLIRNSTKDNLQYFTDLKRQFLVHQSLFWIRRSQKLYFKSLKEAFSVCYYYIELKAEIMALMKRFPYDSSIYIQYGEFLLFACGDFDNHLRCIEIASELKVHKLAIEDPLLHPMLNFSPRIMQFCKVNKKINCMDSTFTDTTLTTNNNISLHPNGSSSTMLDTKFPLRKNESGTDDSFLNSVKVSTLITPSKRNIPFWPIYNIILVFVFFFVFFGLEIRFENVTTNESNSIRDKLTNDVNSITEISANCIITIATSHYIMYDFASYKQNRIGLKSKGLGFDDTRMFTKSSKRKLLYFNNNENKSSNFIFVKNNTQKNFDVQKLNTTSKKSSIRKNLRSKIKPKNSNINLKELKQDDACFDSIKQVVSSSYELLDDWIQISYTSQTLSDALYNFFYYAIYTPEETCSVIESITDYIVNVTTYEFDQIQESIQQINDQIASLDHHMHYRYYIYLFCGISVAYSIFFILLYIFIIVIQVNSIFKDDEIAVKFLSSKEKLSMMILEQTEESWQLLLQFFNENVALQNMKIDSNTSIGIQSHKSFFIDTADNTPNTTRNNTRNNTANSTINNNLTTASNTNTNFNNNDNTNSSSKKIAASSSLIISHNDLDLNLNDGKPSMLSISPMNSPSASLDKANDGPSPMMLPRMGRTSVTFTGYPTQLFKSSTDLIGHKQSFKLNRIALSEGQSETDQEDGKTSRDNSLQASKLMHSKKATSTENSIEQIDTISETDPIDGIINQALKKSRYKWLNVVIILFSCWLVLILSMVLFIMPLKLRSDRQIEISSTMIHLGSQINAFFHITELVYYSIIHYDNLTYDEIEEMQASIANYHDLITSTKTILTDLYLKEQCLMLQGVTCTSAARIVFRFMRDPSFSTIDDDIESAVHLYMPACLYFSRQLLTDLLYNDLIELTNRRYSVDVCFFVLVVLFFLVSLHISLVMQKFLNEGFNSLFHYPESLLKKNFNEKEEKKNKKNNIVTDDNDDGSQSEASFPSSILVVSYVAETDEIYSISDNAQSILQRQPQVFISRKFSQTFPLVTDHDSVSNNLQQQNISEIREHLMPDKKNKKTFRTSSTKMNHIIKIVMIEETKQNSVLFIPAGSKNQGENAGTISTAPTTTTAAAAPQKTESLANKLTFFVPSSFAKIFNDENVSAVNYTNCFVIMVRIKDNISFQATEKFFSVINSQVSNYSSINIMKTDGAIMTLSTVSEVQPIIPFLFVRDILNDCKNFAKNKPQLFAPRCFFIINSQYASGEMKEGIEPFLEFEMPNYDKIEKFIYSFRNDFCFFFDELSVQFPGFDKMCNKCENQFEDFHISSIPFTNYISYFSNFI